jgi:hypothetical protein
MYLFYVLISVSVSSFPVGIPFRCLRVDLINWVLKGFGVTRIVIRVGLDQGLYIIVSARAGLSEDLRVFRHGARALLPCRPARS